MKPIVNSDKDLKELILLIKDKFSPNTDVVTERYTNKSGESGYVMMCDNRFADKCPKKKGQNQKSKRLTDNENSRINFRVMNLLL